MYILKAGKEENWQKNKMNINMSLNYICNFSCSYCINKSRRMSTELNTHFDLDMLEKFLHDLFTLKKDLFHFNIAGGEPSLYKHLYKFYELVQENANKNIAVTLATNGSQLDRIEKCIEISPNVKKNFELSMHVEQRSIEKYEESLKKFKYPELLVLKYLVKPNDFANADRIKELADRIGASFTAHSIVLDGKLDPNYTEEEKDKLKEYEDIFRKNFFVEVQTDDKKEYIEFSRNDFLIQPELSNYKGLHCTAGMNHINVTPSGKVFRCYADTTNVNFSLQNNSILEYPNISSCTPCGTERCNCPPLTALPKWRKGENPPYYVENNLKQEVKTCIS